MNSNELKKLQYAQKLLKEVASSYKTEDPFSPLDIAALSIENVITKEVKRMEKTGDLGNGLHLTKEGKLLFDPFEKFLEQVVHADPKGSVTVESLMTIINKRTGWDLFNVPRLWELTRRVLINKYNARIQIIRDTQKAKIIGISFNAGV